MNEKQLRRKALASILAMFPPEEIDALRAKLERSGRLFPMAESLFDWVKELYLTPDVEATEELVQGLTFFVKRVSQELKKLSKEENKDAV